MSSFQEKLERRVENVGAPLCVGIDPHKEFLSSSTPEALYSWCMRMIEDTVEDAACYKPNSAFFERFGWRGMQVLEQTLREIPSSIPVLLDAKRGDIGSTAEAYAEAVFTTLGADAVTVSPFLGKDAAIPFLRQEGKGVFFLCRTSNPSAREFQEAQIGGEPYYLHIARQVMEWESQGSVGLVVGATALTALARVREVAPESWILVPGVGAQGGSVSDVLRAGGGKVLIPLSRTLAQAKSPKEELRKFRDEVLALPRAPLNNSGCKAFSRTEEVALLLAEAGVLKFGSFVLKSTKVSPFYIDMRRLVGYPSVLQRLGELLIEFIREQGIRSTHLGAIPYAALPIGIAASMIGGYSFVYPRKEVKEYGTKASVEGVYTEGDSVLLLDDLTTTGESKLEAIEKLSSAGLQVKDILVILDRVQGAAQFLQSRGFTFHALTTLPAVLQVLHNHKKIDDAHYTQILQYLDQEK